MLCVWACAEIAGPISALQKSCETATDCPEEGWGCYEGYCLQRPTVCDGDGIVEAGEACDDGNRYELDGCSNQCTLARCGDGFHRRGLAPGAPGYEACDDGNEDNGDACTNDCREASCGDGILAQGHGEECEDGNRNDDDGCLNNCRLARCGDAVVQVGVEACDDGNEKEDDACLNNCSEAACGDGTLRLDVAAGALGFEACDDGNEINDDGCSNDCELPRCGDGILAEANGEECDDGNENNTDECVDNKEDIRCQLARCGDGFLRQDLAEGEDGYELCDDGNAVDGDGCTNDCQLPRCGDGVVRTDIEPGFPGFEACDDGNAVETDACLSSCEQARCGDGLIQADVEACDDGNRVDTDACLNDCRIASCGDGRFNPEAEPCDDGNEIEDDACRTGCIPARCGDDIIRRDIVDRGSRDFEDCEPGIDSGTLFCGEDCRLRPQPRRLAASNRWTCARRSGSVWCWGRRHLLEGGLGREPGAVEPEPMGYATLISSPRDSYVCGIMSSGVGSCHEAWSWRSFFFAVPSGLPMLDLAVDKDGWLCMARQDGRVECRFKGDQGGRLIENIQGAVDVELGGCALDAAGQLHCWGDDGIAEAQAVERPLRQIAYGKSCEPDRPNTNGWCLLDPDGVVWALVDGEAQAQTVFSQDVIQLAGAPGLYSGWDSMACAVDVVGAVFCARAGQNQAERVRGLPPIVEIVVAAESACAWSEDGSIYCWGDNDHFRVDGDADENTFIEQPVRVEGLPPP